ncbi:MAG TPA: hypothetical protein VFF87_08270 [Hyphomicrobium sp.]|nr:hypothetical protein [Hyphomicrobium sp.]
MEKLALFPVLALGAGLVLNAVTSSGIDSQAHAQQVAEATATLVANSEIPADIIAVQIRKQGYECKEPARAERDQSASRADLPVWILTCENAKYRVRLVGNMADHVEKL